MDRGLLSLKPCVPDTRRSSGPRPWFFWVWHCGTLNENKREKHHVESWKLWLQWNFDTLQKQRKINQMTKCDVFLSVVNRHVAHVLMVDPLMFASRSQDFTEGSGDRLALRVLRCRYLRCLHCYVWYSFYSHFSIILNIYHKPINPTVNLLLFIFSNFSSTGQRVSGPLSWGLKQWDLRASHLSCCSHRPDHHEASKSIALLGPCLGSRARSF